jgi:hypothetical protein
LATFAAVAVGLAGQPNAILFRNGTIPELFGHQSSFFDKTGTPL